MSMEEAKYHQGQERRDLIYGITKPGFVRNAACRGTLVMGSESEAGWGSGEA